MDDECEDSDFDFYEGDVLDGGNHQNSAGIDEDDGLDMEEADDEEEDASVGRAGAEEVYYDQQQQQQQQQEQQQVMDAPGRRRKKKSSLAKFDKLLRSSAALSQTMRAVHDIARSQFMDAAGEKEAADQRAPIKKRKLQYRNDVASAIGYERTDTGKESVDAFASRLDALSSNDVFGVKRQVTLAANRFMPFGTSDLLSNAADFYTRPTRLACIWCTEPFSGNPIPCPMKYRAATATREFYFLVNGQFCSFNCLLADQRKENRPLSIARLMMKLVYGIPMHLAVQEAPSRLSLAKFGGLYTIEQFRATPVAQIRTVVVNPPFFPFLAGITEIEKIEVTISEVGGKDLVARRLRGPALGTIAPVIAHTGHGESGPGSRRLQKSKFATALSIDEQLALADRKYRLQREQTAADVKKRVTLTDFMRPKKVE
jgi:hypothetical protein